MVETVQMPAACDLLCRHFDSAWNIKRVMFLALPLQLDLIHKVTNAKCVLGESILLVYFLVEEKSQMF